jgi:MFS family permease
MSVSSVTERQESESRLGYYGWRVVLAAHFGVMVSFGSLLVFTFSIFLKPLSAEFGWSREGISRAFGFAAITVACCSPLLGKWLDRSGPRRIILPCMTVFGIGFASLALLTSHLWHLYAIFVLLGAVGNGTTQMGYSRAVSSWFDLRRGIALSCIIAGVGVGSVVLPFLAQSIITLSGWRAAYACLGGLILILGIPLTARFVREADVVRAAPMTYSGCTVAEGLRSRAFWILIAMLILSSVSINGAITQLSALLTDRKVAAESAALVASILGASSFGSRLMAGWLLDRFFGPRVAFALLSLAAAGIYILASASTFWAGALAAILIGLGLGGEAAITPYLLTRYFGLRSFSTLYGFTWTFYALAGATGPIILGRAFDMTGSYARLLVILAGGTLVAAIAMIFMPRYSRPT